MQPHSKLSLLFVFILLALCAVICSAAMKGELRCQCIKTVSQAFPPRHIKNVELFPKGPHCTKVEIIATLKNGIQRCLDPETKWVQRMITRIVSSASNRN